MIQCLNIFLSIISTTITALFSIEITEGVSLMWVIISVVIGSLLLHLFLFREKGGKSNE